MAGIRWGKFSGKNRGGAGEQARKCEKFEGKDAVKGNEGEGVKNRGLSLRTRCTKTSVVNGPVVEAKSNPSLDSKGLQGEGKEMDFCEFKGKLNPSSNILHKEGIIKKTDLCEKGVDGTSNKIKTKSNLNNKRVVFFRTFESYERGDVGADFKEKLADVHFTGKGIWGMKQGMCENQCMDYTKKVLWDIEKCVEDVKKGRLDSECRKDAAWDTQENEGAKQGILDMEHHMSNCTQMLHVGVHGISVGSEKKAYSVDKSGDSILTDSKNSVAFDKAGDVECRKIDVHEAQDAGCIILTQSNASIGSDSKSSKVLQSKVCNAEFEEKNDDVYEKTARTDSDLVTIPHNFMCGISKKVMQDPVVIASGQTFERACIQAWLDEGNTVCPVTHKPLAHLQLIPNLTLKALISSWYSHSHGSGIESTQHSSLSCKSSSSCPSLTTAHHQNSISCSGLSVSTLLEETELYSSSSSSSSLLPKLLMDVGYESFSLSSVSVPSYGTPEHLRLAGIYNFPSPTSTSSHSSSWGQGREAFAVQENGLQSATSMCRRQGEDDTVMPKISYRGSLHGKSTDSMLSSAKPCAYIISRINALVSDLRSRHRDIQRSAAAELRLLSKDDDSNRLMIASAGALRPLVALLWSRDDSIQLDTTTTLLNLSLNHSLKDKIVKEGAIEALVIVLSDGRLTAAKENAAVTLASLAMSEENKRKIGSVGAIEPLVDLLERGSPRGQKDAATALYRLSSYDENKQRIVREGATRLLVGCMSKEGDKDGMVDKAMAILGNLVCIEEGRVAFVKEGGLMSLMQILPTGASKQSTGLAVSILLQLCTHSSMHRLLVLQKNPLPTLMELSKTGNTRLKSQIAEVIQVLLVDAY